MDKGYHLVLMSYWRTAAEWFVSYLKKNNVKKIAYIMNANKRNYIANPDYRMYDLESYQQAGFDVTVVDLDELDKTPNIFDDVDLVYVRGGNTFDILDAARRSGFDKLLAQLLERGVLYASSSAGSILVAPNIEIAENDFAPDYNLVGLKDTAGLSCVDFAVFPHWEERWQEELNKLKEAKKVTYPIRCLTDRQVLIVKDGKEKIIEL